MRLICPNCNAQYNVDEALIPEEGRDVQCATCKNTWFQEKAFVDAPLRLTTPVAPNNPAHATKVGPTGPAGPAGPAAPRKTLGGGGSKAAEAESTPPVNDQIDRNELRRAVEEELAAKSAPQIAEAAQAAAKDEDAELLQTLRDQLSQAGDDFETGPESSRRRSVVKAAESAGIPADELLADRTRKVTPHDLSIDFAEEINETIIKERSIRGGLITALVLAGIATGIYFFKPDISEAYPPAKPYLDQYTNSIDSARGGIESAAAMVGELIANRDEPAEEVAEEAPAVSE